jgi:DNA (cytosine-5)-methyltransferase 1
MPLRYAEFCAGVGGFRLGLQLSDADVQLVYSNEIDNSCEKTYERNFEQKFDSKDIFSIDASTIPDFDMLCAGFPCQPFSAAGKELGFADARGTVFFKLLEIIKIKKPGIVFLENVPNLIHHNDGKTYKTILDSLADTGYALSPVVLDSSYFGVPQSRSRIYIIGLCKKKYGNLKVIFTQKKTPKTSLARVSCVWL